MLRSARRSFTAIAAAFAVVVAVLTIYTPTSASADTCQKWSTDSLGNKTCVLYGPGTPGSGGPGDGVGIVCDSTGHITYEGQVYVCDLPGGWSFSYGCYIKEMDPQPPVGDPMWGNADPSITRMQYVSCGVMPPTVPGNRLPVAGPCVGTCAGINPVQAVTAQLAIDKPALGMSPQGSPPGGPVTTGFVNQNVWFWSKGLDTTTQTRQAGNVVGTRTFGGAVWTITRAGQTDPVDKPALTCTSDYEYTPDKGSAPSPDPNCGFQFKNPGDYVITVQTTWTLLITQNGIPGQPQTVTSTPNTVDITILEGQSTNG
jgi:hypothetical protein